MSMKHNLLSLFLIAPGVEEAGQGLFAPAERLAVWTASYATYAGCKRGIGLHGSIYCHPLVTQ